MKKLLVIFFGIILLSQSFTMSYGQWTDYNEHDPGVSKKHQMLLEQKKELEKKGERIEKERQSYEKKHQEILDRITELNKVLDNLKHSNVSPDKIEDVEEQLKDLHDDKAKLEKSESDLLEKEAEFEKKWNDLENKLEDFEKINSEKKYPVFEPTQRLLPAHLKQVIEWWSDDIISDKEFATGLGFLVKENLIVVDTPVEMDPTGTQIQVDDDIDIPDWIRNNAKWYVNEQISERDFVMGIEFLMNTEIISFEEKTESNDFVKGHLQSSDFKELESCTLPGYECEVFVVQKNAMANKKCLELNDEVKVDFFWSLADENNQPIKDEAIFLFYYVISPNGEKYSGSTFSKEGDYSFRTGIEKITKSGLWTFEIKSLSFFYEAIMDEKGKIWNPPYTLKDIDGQTYIFYDNTNVGKFSKSLDSRYYYSDDPEPIEIYIPSCSGIVDEQPPDEKPPEVQPSIENSENYVFKDFLSEDDRPTGVTQPTFILSGDYSKPNDKIQTKWEVYDAETRQGFSGAKITITVQKNNETPFEKIITTDNNGIAINDVNYPIIGDSYTFMLKQIEYDETVWNISEIIDVATTNGLSIVVPNPELKPTNPKSSYYEEVPGMKDLSWITFDWDVETVSHSLEVLEGDYSSNYSALVTITLPDGKKEYHWDSFVDGKISAAAYAYHYKPGDKFTAQVTSISEDSSKFFTLALNDEIVGSIPDSTSFSVIEKSHQVTVNQAYSTSHDVTLHWKLSDDREFANFDGWVQVVVDFNWDEIMGDHHNVWTRNSYHADENGNVDVTYWAEGYGDYVYSLTYLDYETNEYVTIEDSIIKFSIP